jgi:hypothetical protein
MSLNEGVSAEMKKATGQWDSLTRRRRDAIMQDALPQSKPVAVYKAHPLM